MVDRRELLKRFGIGALIAPIIGGQVDQASTAKLIEVPKIEPIEIFKEIPTRKKAVQIRHVKSAQIVLGMQDGTTETLDVRVNWARGEVFEGPLGCGVDIEFFLAASPRAETAIISGIVLP